MDSETQSNQTTLKAKSFDFTWEKRHWLIIIGLVCLTLWWFASSLKTTPWVQSGLNLLPAVGGLAFAADSLFKLAL